MIPNNYSQINLLKPVEGDKDLQRTKNLACVVAVSDPYIETALANLEKLSSWDVCILTDQPERFDGFFYVEEYKNAVFSLGDKIIFSLRMSMKFRTGVTLIDADEMEKLKQSFIDARHDYENFKCISSSDFCHVNLNERPLGKAFREHINLLGLKEGERTKVINEQCYYMPFTKKIPDVIYYNEITKPSVDHASIWGGNRRKIIGEGEGLSLYVSLYRVGIEIEFYEESPLKTAYEMLYERRNRKNLK